MENNTELHTQKIAILSRLIKESSLTLEEALLLLKEEEVVENQTVITTTPSFNPLKVSTSPYWHGSGTTTTTGTFPSFIGTSINTQGSTRTFTTTSNTNMQHADL